jgi:hypothetical protein
MSPHKPPDPAIPTDPTDRLVISVTRARARTRKPQTNQPVGSVGSASGDGRLADHPVEAPALGLLSPTDLAGYSGVLREVMCDA